MLASVSLGAEICPNCRNYRLLCLLLLSADELYLALIYFITLILKLPELFFTTCLYLILSVYSLIYLFVQSTLNNPYV